MRKTVALRQVWLDTWGHGIFRDTEDLECCHGMVKKFEIANGVLVACAEEGGLSDSVYLRWTRSEKVKITLLTEENPTPVVKEISVPDGLLRLENPKTELALFAVEAL